MIERIDPELRTICRRLSGEAVVLSAVAIDIARRHHVQFLLASRLTPAEIDWAGLNQELHGAVALTALRDVVLRDLLQQLAEAGIDALVIKGAALAHTAYALAHQRPRTDIDLFIRTNDVERADRVLLAAGWTRAVETDGAAITSQRHYDRDMAGATEHLDLHWKVANASVFADVIEFDDAWRRSVGVPTLGPAARTLGAADALLLACIHPVAHHYNAAPLIWVWDIHALASELNEQSMSLFVKLAERRRMRAVCSRGLTRAQECFGTSIAERLIAALDAGTAGTEPSAAFLQTDRLIQVVASDLRHAPTWPARIRIVQEHLFPAAAYMRGRYPKWPRPFLPLAYAYRIARGAPGWFRSRKN